MAAKGATAKVNVENKIREAFGADFVGNVDKKLYVWADDGGEKVQICLTMTCPKVPVGVGGENDGIDFDNMPIRCDDNLDRHYCVFQAHVLCHDPG